MTKIQTNHSIYWREKGVAKIYAKEMGNWKLNPQYTSWNKAVTVTDRVGAGSAYKTLPLAQYTPRFDLMWIPDRQSN